jgi:fructose transport system permease protein
MSVRFDSTSPLSGSVRAAEDGAPTAARDDGAPAGETTLIGFAAGVTTMMRLRNALAAHPTIVSFIVLIVSVLGFGLVVGERFFTPFNFSLIVQQVTIISILGAAQTLVILTAGIDLSVGAIMVLCSVIMGETAVHQGWPQELAIVLAFAGGGICGLINGLLVTSLRLPPFVATLGTWNVFFGINLWLSGSMTIMSQEISSTAPMLQFFGDAINFGRVHLTIGTFMMFALFGALWYALYKTAWGRHVHAIGDDEEATRLAGISVEGKLVSVYVVAGLICALGGWVLIGRIGSVTPQEGVTANLDSITAVVVGGTSLFGGRGSLLGTLVGALIVGVYRNGLALSGADPLWQNVAVGILIVVAVTIDQWIRRLSR